MTSKQWSLHYMLLYSLYNERLKEYLRSYDENLIEGFYLELPNQLCYMKLWAGSGLWEQAGHILLMGANFKRSQRHPVVYAPALLMTRYGLLFSVVFLTDKSWPKPRQRVFLAWLNTKCPTQLKKRIIGYRAAIIADDKPYICLLSPWRIPPS